MKNSVEIKSSNDGTTLTFSNPVFVKSGNSLILDYFTVSIESSSYNGCISVYAYQSEGLPVLFQFLATNWRGWEGKKEWSSLEGEFTVSVTCDKLGHSKLEFSLINYDSRWKLEGELVLDAGSLEMISSEIHQFWFADDNLK